MSITLIVGLLVLSLTGCIMERPENTAADQVHMIESVYNTNVANLISPDRDYLIIVNEDHPYDFDGKYNKSLQTDLVFIPNDVDGDTIAVEKAAYLAFTQLQRDLEVNHGMRIGLYDAYRTAEDQKFLLELYKDNAFSKSFEPGFSEHHTGLLLNVVIWYSEDGENYEWYTESAERQQTIPYFKLLHEKLADYGFIDRYPEGKEDITGVPCEPYEIRFVGGTDIAHAITAEKNCLEEYIAEQNKDEHPP